MRGWEEPAPDLARFPERPGGGGEPGLAPGVDMPARGGGGGPPSQLFFWPLKHSEPKIERSPRVSPLRTHLAPHPSKGTFRELIAGPGPRPRGRVSTPSSLGVRSAVRGGGLMGAGGVGRRPRRPEQPGKGQCSTLPPAGLPAAARAPGPSRSRARPCARPASVDPCEPCAALLCRRLLPGEPLNLTQKRPKRHFEQYGREKINQFVRVNATSHSRSFPGFS